MVTISELCVEHRHLEAEVRKLLGIISRPVPDTAAVAGVRWRLAQGLFEHCAREDRAVYDRLVISGDARAIASAWAYRREHGALGEAFGRYIADWPVDRIAREWEAFRIDTASIAHRIASRIESEESDLYPHAERIIERRAAA